MLIYAVSYFFRVLMFLLLVRAVMSWVVRDTRHPFVNLVYQLTEPILLPVRELFYKLGLMNSGIDFSFLATIILLQLVENVVIRVLISAGL